VEIPEEAEEAEEEVEEAEANSLPLNPNMKDNQKKNKNNYQIMKLGLPEEVMLACTSAESPLVF